MMFGDMLYRIFKYPKEHPEVCFSYAKEFLYFSTFSYFSYILRLLSREVSLEVER